MQFTEEQVNHFRKYERVRRSGKYNMWDFRAVIATGLTQDQYFFVMSNFDQLREKAEAVTQE